MYEYLLRFMAWVQGKPYPSKATQKEAADEDSDDEDAADRAATTKENFLQLSSEEQWKELMEKESRPVVGYFTGSWCKPCKATTPHLQQLSKEHTDVVFVTVDATKFESLHMDQDVMALPTTKTYKFGKVQGSVTGANLDAITSLVAKAAA